MSKIRDLVVGGEVSPLEAIYLLGINLERCNVTERESQKALNFTQVLVMMLMMLLVCV